MDRSCVRSVTGNGFMSVKGDIKKMKNTVLPTCTLAQASITNYVLSPSSYLHFFLS